MGFDQDYWLVLHLMIAGRLHWRDLGSAAPGTGVKKLASRSRDVAAFDFDSRLPDAQRGGITQAGLDSRGGRRPESSRTSTRAGSKCLSPAWRSSRLASPPRTIP